MKLWRRYLTRFIAAALVFSLPSVGTTSTAPSTNMNSALLTALAWHPSITTAKAKLTEQQHRERVARAGYLPQVSGGLKGGYEGRGSDQEFSQALTFSVSQMLYDFGKVRHEVTAEQALVLKQQAELFMAIEDTIHNTAQAVLESWRYQELEAMALAQHRALQKLTDLVAERHQKGAASRSDLAQSKTRVEGAYTQVLQYRNQKQLWHNRLASLLGKQQPHSVRSQPGPIAATSCAFTHESVEEAPALKVAFALRDSADAVAKQANARSLPTISLDPTLTHYLKDPNWGNQSNPDKTEYGIYLNVNMPLYQGGALSAERKLAQATKMAAEADIMAERQHILESLFTSSSQREVLTHHLGVLSQREALSQETRRLYQQQYMELGTRPLIDLLNAEQEIFQTRFERINIHHEMQLAALTCAHALGQLRPLFALEDAVIQGVNLAP
ncbi:MAG TPA: TolC family outer membrane protein [Alcanivoracaceae bacterium]|nr:TolC family outer membrane protein [Alcanivoracaceae bacterium]